MKGRVLVWMCVVVLGLTGCDQETVTPGELVDEGEASNGLPAEGGGGWSSNGQEGQGDAAPNGQSGGVTWGDEEGSPGGESSGTGTGTSFDGTFCNGDADCPEETPYCSASGLCLECLSEEECAAGEVCTSGVCLPDSCSPGETTCSGTTLLTCSGSGTDWDSFTCPGVQAQCVDGACTGCDPGYKECFGKDQVLSCLSDGSGLVSETCSGGFCVEGVCAECYPGTKQCNGDWAQTCAMSGVWENAQDCAGLGGECSAGACSSACGMTGKLSNEGCDYWVVDMDNKGPAADSPYAVVVSNLNTTPVSITVTAQSNAYASPTTVASGTVAPGDLEVFQLPQQNMGTSGIYWKAARVEATGPIVAYQFNPLENVDVFSNDASLLLPSNTFGQEYIVVSREEIPSDKYGSFRGSFSVVAMSADTEVTILPSAPTKAGAELPALSVGQSHTVTLQPYQVLNVQSDLMGSDLTGTQITSTKPVAVFGGHEAAVGDEQCCADHLEQQLFPVSTWGKTYVATKSSTRGVERDYWRMIASKDGTSVSLTPPLPGVPNPISLNKGQFYEFQTDQDFSISSTEPIMVAQTLPSSGEITGPPACVSTSDCAPGYSCSWVSPECMLDSPYCSTSAQCPGSHSCRCDELGFCSCEPMGDPALILAVPVEQYRSSYVFLTPTNYVEDYINVIAPAGASVTLDGQELSSSVFQLVGEGAYKVARLPVIDGVHTLESTEPVGVVAYGYDEDVSYGYPAGLSLANQP